MCEFIVDATMPISSFGGYELELNRSGESVRIRENFGHKDSGVTGWIDIEYDIDGDAWFEFNDEIYYLNQFMRVEAA